jgi:hypothetical protein
VVERLHALAAQRGFAQHAGVDVHDPRTVHDREAFPFDELGVVQVDRDRLDCDARPHNHRLPRVVRAAVFGLDVGLPLGGLLTTNVFGEHECDAGAGVVLEELPLELLRGDHRAGRIPVLPDAGDAADAVAEGLAADVEEVVGGVFLVPVVVELDDLLAVPVLVDANPADVHRDELHDPRAVLDLLQDGVLGGFE